MQQSSALRRLDEILNDAVANGDRNQQAGPVLLKAMKLSDQSENVVDFYEILNKAKEEAKRVKNNPRIAQYIQRLEELNQFFIVNHIWGTKWDVFANHIDNRGILLVLDALANYFYFQDPTVFLEQDFLEKLNSEFEVLLNKILNSDLSKELKKFLVKRVEDILSAIRRYYIDGTEGLVKATQSLISDLGMTEHTLKEEDKKNHIYMQVKVWALGLLLYIAPSPYDIIGAVPDISNFWVPKFEELVTGHKKIEKIVWETPTIQEAVEKASNVFDKQLQKSITGSKELKALPASKEDLETNENDKSNP